MLLKNLYNSRKNVFLKISADKQKKFIKLDWFGFQSFETLKNGAEEALEQVKAFGYDKMLVDNRNIKGPWDMANDWYAENYNPRLFQAGLKHMAVIVSPDIFAQISLENYEQRANQEGIFQVKIFETEIDATLWLLEN